MIVRPGTLHFWNCRLVGNFVKLPCRQESRQQRKRLFANSISAVESLRYRATTGEEKNNRSSFLTAECRGVRSVVPRFPAVVFDLDGTLLDTLADIAGAANHVLEQHGGAPFAIEAYRDLIGDGVTKLFSRTLPGHLCTDATIQRCVVECRDAYGRMCKMRTKPYDGVSELVRSLATNNILTAVLSNKPHDSTQRCVNHYCRRHAFQSVLGQREGVPPKPDPAGALEIARHLSVTPDECAYLGDTPTDMQTATAAGMFAVGVTWGFRSREELQADGARVLIEDSLELLPILELKTD